MPLSTPAPREHLHTRSIECKGYQRADGLWDIEGHITDVKTYSFSNEWRGEVTPGIPLHEMWIRLTLDDDFVVQGVEAATDNSPYSICPSAAPNFQKLKGLKIGKGWNKTVKELLGNTEGCTHIVELLPQMATVSFQTIRAFRRARKSRTPNAETMGAKERSPQLNTCYAWSTEREVVQRWLPEFYTGKPSVP
jgi:Protein of unknown function (DUF2889)